jgi:RNA polymerase sigma factor (sigma-70 family)
MESTPFAPVPPSPDGELLCLVQSGDREAFRLLFRRHQQAVYLTAARVLRSPTDAEEIMQDTFLTLWNKRSTITLVGESTLPWLVTTARFLALNRHRATARIRSESLDDAAHLAVDGPLPEEAALAREQAELLDALIAEMPQVDQEILNLCLIDELSYAQAARQLGITHGAVRNRLSRLKGRLRSHLEPSKEAQQP